MSPLRSRIVIGLLTNHFLQKHHRKKSNGVKTWSTASQSMLPLCIVHDHEIWFEIMWVFHVPCAILLTTCRRNLNRWYHWKKSRVLPITYTIASSRVSNFVFEKVRASDPSSLNILQKLASTSILSNRGPWWIWYVLNLKLHHPL